MLCFKFWNLNDIFNPKVKFFELGRKLKILLSKSSSLFFEPVKNFNFRFNFLAQVKIFDLNLKKYTIKS